LQQLPLEVATAGDDGIFTGIEDSAVGCVEGEVVEFLTQGEYAAQQGCLAFGHIRRKGGSRHDNFRVLRKELIPYTLNHAISTREVGYTHPFKLDWLLVATLIQDQELFGEGGALNVFGKAAEGGEAER
jgi:hypothetical protein